ncbi:hypothetical protein DPMN_044719 [Dreissena polymorpha]|uniref:Uncharacterized protein n=1 Tax=Dreissena polymorpha TaxID=45954 RepID=A0A9D4I0Q9_DREPO|nr:hypothetical protein DPMN_044719 [Dreissena polymorpha]
MPDITQIAAVDFKKGSKFSTCVKQSLPNIAEVQKVAGIYVDANDNMSLNGGYYDSVCIMTC